MSVLRAIVLVGILTNPLFWPILAWSGQIESRCNCSEIGLDSLWADSNQVACYRVAVAVDTDDSTGSTYSLAVAVVAPSGKNAGQSLLYLHGGPGIATLENIPRYLRSRTFAALRESHALIFFDYRGTGFSEPRLCDDFDRELHEIDRRDLPQEELIARTVNAYRACREVLDRRGVDLTSFSSLHSACDADAIRRTLSIDHLDVYAVSHGTTVALHMMRSFPMGIRSVILDSPYPPNAAWVDYVQPFDTCFRVIEQRLSEDSGYASIFPSIRHDFTAITKRLDQKPFMLRLESKSDSTQHLYAFKAADFAWTVWTALLNPEYIRYVPLLLQRVALGDDSTLQAWAAFFHDPDAFGDFSNAQSRAVLCYEGRPRTAEDSEAHLLATFPDFSSLIIPGMDDSVCAVWQHDLPPEGYFDPVVSAVPTLILAGELDPVCPPVFADIAARSLAKSTVVVVPGASHAAIHSGDCVRTLAREFLARPDSTLNIDCVKGMKTVTFVTSGDIQLPK